MLLIGFLCFLGILLIGDGAFIFFSDLFCTKTIRRFFDAEMENESTYLIGTLASVIDQQPLFPT